MPLIPITYLFFRENGFYSVAYRDDAEAIKGANNNPGTLKVETPGGRLVWSPEQSAPDELATVKAQRDRLRAALAGLVGASGLKDLEEMHAMVSIIGQNRPDIAEVLEGIQALIDTHQEAKEVTVD